MAAAPASAAAGTAPLRVALGEYDLGWEDPATSLDRAERVVARASEAGAQLVVLPEMCPSGFTMDAARWAEPLDGVSARRLASIAAAHGTWVMAGLAVRDADGARNAALLFDPAGALAGEYRKQRLFAHGGEDAAYLAGRAPAVWTVNGVRIAPLVCYDLRFPELFRPVAREVDAYALVANWPLARRAHWGALLRARAIENLAYVVGVNRTGEGGGARYDGGSVVIDPWGDLVTASMRGADAPAVADVDPGRVAAVRARYRFLDDYAAEEAGSLLDG